MSKNKLPKGMRKCTKGKHTYYFYDSCTKEGRTWISLGKDYYKALIKYADLEIKAQTKITYNFKDVADRYIIEVLPTKALQTQKGNLQELSRLLDFFNDPPCPIDEIKPIHIRQYLDWRKESPVAANREKALFSHMFNKAREWGYTDNQNPCTGISGYKETGRDIYVTDDDYIKLWNAGSQELRNALDLAYLTGQRPADVLKMCAEDIINSELHVLQNKTGQRLRIVVEGKLKELIEKLPKEGRLLRDEYGNNLTRSLLNKIFKQARAASGVDFQFRDLRAKAGTDKEESQGMAAAKDQLGHTNESMTNQYVRHRSGKKVTPTK